VGILDPVTILDAVVTHRLSVFLTSFELYVAADRRSRSAKLVDNLPFALNNSVHSAEQHLGQFSTGHREEGWRAGAHASALSTG
jgi:hypothetical protein